MPLGQYQLQIVASVLVILGAAALALICDFLKRKSDRLRELTIALQSKHNEDLRRAIAVRAVEPAAGATPKPHPTVKPAIKQGIKKEKKRPAHSTALAAMQRGAALAGSGKTPPKVEAAAPPPATGAKRD